MNKKLLTIILLVAISITTFYSCRKTDNFSGDATRNYFPLKFGKSVTYAVDSTYYIGESCVQLNVKSQHKYSITDSFTDSKKRPTYVMSVFSRPYDGGIWKPLNVIFITPTPTGLLYTQDNSQYIKLTFPIVEGSTWKGNEFVQVNDSAYAYLKDWDYTYQNFHRSFNTNYINFENTISVLERDESVNYPDVDSAVHAYRTYAKEVYAYNVGMVYKEWTHWRYRPDTAQCVDGYRVVMRAIDHN